MLNTPTTFTKDSKCLWVEDGFRSRPKSPVLSLRKKCPNLRWYISYRQLEQWKINSLSR